MNEITIIALVCAYLVGVAVAIAAGNGRERDE